MTARHAGGISPIFLLKTAGESKLLACMALVAYYSVHRYNSEAAKTANSFFGNIDVAIHVSGSIDCTIPAVNLMRMSHGIWESNDWYPVRLVRSWWIFLDLRLIRGLLTASAVQARSKQVFRPHCCPKFPRHASYLLRTFQRFSSNDLTSGSSQLSVCSSEYLVNAILYRLCRDQV